MSEFSLNDDDVVCITPNQTPTKTTTSKVGEIKVSFSVELQRLANWVNDVGVDGSVLLAEGGGWQTGKLRLQIVFVPDQPKRPDVLLPRQPESPLDDLRATLD